MGLGPKQWECKDCGYKHRAKQKQCARCGYIVLGPVDPNQGMGKLLTTILALLPAILSLLTIGILAWVLFF